MLGSPTKAKVRIVVVEDDPLMLLEIAALIASRPDFHMQASAASVQEALPALEQPYDLLLLDLGLPDGNGLELLAKHQAQQAQAKCLVMTVFDSREQTLKALAAGADGYVLKSDSNLLARMDEVLSSANPISAAVAGHLVTAYRSSIPSTQTGPHTPAPNLTTRESQTLSALAKGLSYQGIAGVLEVSPNTVTDYIKGLYKKLSVNSRSEAVYAGLKLGLIRVDAVRENS